jgi:hypothetical protein
MAGRLEYHRSMRLGMLVFALLIVTSITLLSSAQVNGVPPSVNSYGFGGQPGFHGVPPSVTSLGPRGATTTHTPHQPNFQQHPGGGHHRPHQGSPNVYYVPYYIPYYPVMEPYEGPAGEEANSDPYSAREPDQGGPTIFDRRGSGMLAPNDYKAADEAGASNETRSGNPAPLAKKDSASPPASTAVPEDAIANDSSAKVSDSAIALQPSTVLIFKDGHKQEVSNYAIVGGNLFDLTPGHRLKIPLTDLDLGATQKANDDLGTDFKLPTGN